MAKNIVVFSDGTAKEGGIGDNTNVYKLFNMIEDRTDRQVGFYDRGLGTGWRKVTGKVAGAGISENILECYEFIFEQYQAGDNIFLFGFSRGATTVRSLSGFIRLFGILPKSRPELIRDAYNIYRIRNPRRRDRRAAEFVKRHHRMRCRIKFLGVWDTVAALGIPIRFIDTIARRIGLFRHRFHDLRLSEGVEHARHALAVDDERLVFHPTLWERELQSYQTMKQVWFCGMHSDVGGGYPEKQLSDIPLGWMIQEAKNHGLLIYPGHEVPYDANANGVMHDSRGRIGRLIYSGKVRSWNSNARGAPVVHESVTQRALGGADTPVPLYAPWVLDMDHNVEPWAADLRGKQHVT